MSLFSFITDINGFFEWNSNTPILFDPPRLLNLTKISDPKGIIGEKEIKRKEVNSKV